jgi:ABC-type dipeptide/oligopeptide/nickel transport system permease component
MNAVLSVFNGIINLLGGASMVKFVIRRVLAGIPVLLLTALAAFTLIRLIPGGPFDFTGSKSTPVWLKQAIESRYGLNKPLLLNLPGDGVAPDSGMTTQATHPNLPNCDKLRQGMTLEQATDTTNVTVTEGWQLFRMVDEHSPSQIMVKDGDNERPQPCNTVRTVLYSDLARSQFLEYINNAVRFDFGPSLSRTTLGTPVSSIIGDRLPISMQLGILGTLVGFMIGIPLGVLAAIYHNSVIDYLSTFTAVVGTSVPSYVLGPVLILFFVVQLHWLPGPNPTVWKNPSLEWSYIGRLILPLLTLSLGVAAGIARLTRASLLQVLQDDYIRTARAKGLRERIVIYVHALKNALIPIATIVGPLLAGVLTGTFFVERIFAVPGLGDAFLSSIASRDYNLLTGVTLLYSTFLIIGNILVDIMYTWLDPRIRFD